MLMFSDVASGLYSFNPWALPNFLSAAMLWCVCVSEIISDKGSPFSRYQFAFGILLGFYFLTFGMAYCAVDRQTALAWLRMAYLGVPFIPVPVFFLLPLILGNPAPSRAGRIAVIGSAAFFAVANLFSPLVVADAQRMWWGYTKLYGPLGWLCFAYFAVIVATVFYTIVRKMRKTAHGTATSESLTLLFWACIVLCLIGVDFLPGFSVAFYPAGYVFALIFVGMLMNYRVRYGKSIFNLSMAAGDILSAIHESIVVVDSLGTVIYANPAAHELFGPSRGRLEGRMIHELLPDVPDIGRFGLNTCPESFSDTEFVFKDDTGKSHWVNMSCSTPKTLRGGRRPWAILSFLDITKRKEVEIHLEHLNSRLEMIVRERTKKLISINEKLVEEIEQRKRIQAELIHNEKMISIGRLAAGVAHEINNPLSGILQSSQVVLRRIDPQFEPNVRTAERYGLQLDRVRKYLDDRDITTMMNNIRESASRAAKIVSSMLEFSRKNDSRKEPSDVNSLLDKSVELVSKDYDLNSKYDFRKVAIHKEYAPDLAPVPCVPSQIQQVVLNLLANAAHALSAHGVCGSCPEIHITTGQSEGMAVIEIRDNGPGIPAETQKRIFEPFFTTKQVGVGTGLGLSVAYYIVVNNHGGALEVRSPQTGGAAFTIRLPLREVAAG